MSYSNPTIAASTVCCMAKEPPPTIPIMGHQITGDPQTSTVGAQRLQYIYKTGAVEQFGRRGFSLQDIQVDEVGVFLLEVSIDDNKKDEVTITWALVSIRWTARQMRSVRRAKLWESWLEVSEVDKVGENLVRGQ